MPINAIRWRKRLQQDSRPAYLMMAELIAEDIQRGELSTRERLPTLRDLAQLLKLNYTTVARGYAEAKRRGLIDSHVGIGTVVRGRIPGLPLRSGSSAEMTMNLPPEPLVNTLVQQMQQQAGEALANGGTHGYYELMRYQDFGGSNEARDAGALWLRSHVPQCHAAQVLVGPGIHGVLLALISMLCRPGEVICAEALAYPGMKVIAAQLGVKIQPLPLDDEGVSADEFEHACKTLQVRALVCNPNIHNPTTVSMSLQRRREIADIATRYSVPLIEDDAYGKLQSKPLPTLLSLAPDLTYYIAGLSKSLGAGLRMSYVCTPNPRLLQRTAGALRATTVMGSPFNAAMVTRWIQTGSAQAMLNAIREESGLRQQLARRYLAEHGAQADPEGFHAWVPLREDWNPIEVATTLRAQGLACVASAAFTTDADPPPALRLCLGGSIGREDLQNGLRLLSSVLDQSTPPLASAG
ncbi:PLP-dependent aminotransferase family protein [Curvibacter sp. RS43]|uniref:aminotransferase-like domain-containing protein n=1 Tax=Curvibacter microcysteis TaxID=3026419 RepID=UPI00235F5EA1|nr:PLP-dependent aminotransferase family protein [Curvibacter sp. RS43]MDD0809192.1 PLP-dependent aminotransferase family protein [Curvibacter sp. RS43]